MLSRMHKICGFYIIYFSIELKRGSSKTNVLPLTKRQGVFLIVTTFSICWLQFFLSIMLGHFFTLLKLNKTSGVVLANFCEVYACAPTLLSFLWRNILTLLATVFPISRWVVWRWLDAVELTSNRSSVN